MTINQIIAFCLIAVLIGFLVVLAIMAKHAVELLKKTKTLADKSNEAVDDVKGRFDKLSDDALGAVNAVAADTSVAVKALTYAGIGLTGWGLIKVVIGLFTGTGLFATMSAARERKKAKKEINVIAIATACIGERCSLKITTATSTVQIGCVALIGENIVIGICFIPK